MLDSPQVKKLIQLAVEEDLAFGDITSQLSVAESCSSRALALAKDRLVFCGGPLVAEIFKHLGWQVDLKLCKGEGELAQPAELLFEIEGKTKHLLSAERIILNFLQRLSGVATYTRDFVAAAGQIVVLDTRKTTPGWRVLEKYAVKIGGARNHRSSLGELIMIKDNHVDAAGGDIRALVEEVKLAKPYYMPVELEVRNQHELQAAVESGVDIVMLDNMDDEALQHSLAFLKDKAPQILVEVSGGVKKERLPLFSDLGVNCISTSCLTTQAVWLDISLRIE